MPVKTATLRKYIESEGIDMPLKGDVRPKEVVS